jgi:hypothetical protein
MSEGKRWGRNLLFPPGGYPLRLASAVDSIVHGGLKAEKAESLMWKWEGK